MDACGYWVVNAWLHHSVHPAQKNGVAFFIPLTSNLAFDKRIAMTNDLVVVEATAVSALPKNQQIFGSPKINFKL